MIGNAAKWSTSTSPFMALHQTYLISNSDSINDHLTILPSFSKISTGLAQRLSVPDLLVGSAGISELHTRRLRKFSRSTCTEKYKGGIERVAIRYETEAIQSMTIRKNRAVYGREHAHYPKAKPVGGQSEKRKRKEMPLFYSLREFIKGGGLSYEIGPPSPLRLATWDSTHRGDFEHCHCSTKNLDKHRT